MNRFFVSNLLHFVALNRRNYFTSLAALQFNTSFKLRISFGKLKVHSIQRFHAKRGFFEVFNYIFMRLLSKSFHILGLNAIRERAAVFIQKIIRGHLSRCIAWVEYVYYSSVVLIQSFYRCRLSMKFVAAVIKQREYASTIIQRVLRGYLGRKKAMKIVLSILAAERLKLDLEQKLWIAKRRHVASTKIQSFGRILSARRLVEEVRHQHYINYLAELEFQRSLQNYKEHRMICNIYLENQYKELKRQKLNEVEQIKRNERQRIKNNILYRKLMNKESNHRKSIELERIELELKKKDFEWSESWKSKKAARCDAFKKRCIICFKAAKCKSDKLLRRKLKILKNIR